MRSKRRGTQALGRAEQAVMEYVWKHADASAEQIRKGIKDAWPMKDSTVRTVLLRLERKGYVTHEVKGRAFIYRAAEGRTSAAIRAVRHVIDRFCGGSAEQLVLGLVDQKVVNRATLKRLLARIDAVDPRK